jgi:DNA-binding MarR family transcriptional regulator
MPRTRPLRFDPIDEARRQWRAHSWTEAADGMAAVTSVFRAHQIYLARVDAVLRPLGLTFARYEVLMLLWFSRAGSLPLNNVGARLQVHPTSITNAVDRLEEQGLISRVPHPTDRRTTLAQITAVGRRLAEKATEAVNHEVFEQPGLDPAGVTALVDVLRELRRSEGDFAGESGSTQPRPIESEPGHRPH